LVEHWLRIRLKTVLPPLKPLVLVSVGALDGLAERFDEICEVLGASSNKVQI